MLVAWDHQGDWTNRELTYVCFWKRKAQNISAFSLLSQLFSKINKKYFQWLAKLFLKLLLDYFLFTLCQMDFSSKPENGLFQVYNAFFFNFETYSLMRKSLKPNAGGPRISWFLVPKSNHEMWGSWTPGTVLSVKPRYGSKSSQKSTFWAFFCEILIAFFPIETAFQV